MTPTIRYDVPRAEYDAIDAENWSLLKHLLRSPNHYLAARWAKGKNTPAMTLGRCGHLAVLEPEKFATDVAVWDGGVRRGKEWDAFKAKAVGQEILTVEEHQKCRAVADSVRDFPLSRSLVTGGRSEVTLQWQHKVGPGQIINLKGRVDYEAEALVDLKLTRCAAPRAFFRQAYELGIHIQAALYSDGYFAATGKRKPFYVVAVENEFPFAVTVFRIPEAVLDAGRAEYDRLLSLLALCRVTGNYPGYSDAGPVDLELPSYASVETLSSEEAVNE